HGAHLVARASGTLWWPEARLLVVSDLHLGKSERMARRGGALLPPYESLETLNRLALDITELEPKTVVCLGDSFDDLAAERALEEDSRLRLAALMGGRRWIWIEGNHDAGPVLIGGTHMAALERGPLTFRHIADPSAPAGEVSGHYHPKHKLVIRGRLISRPAFLIAPEKIILPAFGLYTGGLPTLSDALLPLTGPGTLAVMTGPKAYAVPLVGP
ncbi:MAG: ligase-associated DNA damage response endonuclease PdeM, partial [Pseudomonadota bacterium]